MNQRENELQNQVLDLERENVLLRRKLEEIADIIYENRECSEDYSYLIDSESLDNTI